jgi:hypothetical protein
VRFKTGIILGALLVSRVFFSFAAADSTIKLGMDVAKAQVILDGLGAKDISDAIDIKFKSEDKSVVAKLVWYKLPDNTVFQMYVEDTIPDDKKPILLISSMEMGEKGKGYKDRADWGMQDKSYPQEFDPAKYK